MRIFDLARTISIHLPAIHAYSHGHVVRSKTPLWAPKDPARAQMPLQAIHLSLRQKLTCLSGWWLTYPSEKYELVSWDDELPNIWKNKSHIPNHQPTIMNLWNIPIPVTGEDSDRYPDVKATAAGGILLVSPLESPTCAVHPVP